MSLHHSEFQVSEDYNPDNEVMYGVGTGLLLVDGWWIQLLGLLVEAKATSLPLFFLSTRAQNMQTFWPLRTFTACDGALLRDFSYISDIIIVQIPSVVHTSRL